MFDRQRSLVMLCAIVLSLFEPPTGGLPFDEREVVSVNQSIKSFRDAWLPASYPSTRASDFDIALSSLYYNIGHAQLDLGMIDDAIATASLLHDDQEAAHGLLKRAVRCSIRREQWSCCVKALEAISPSEETRLRIVHDELFTVHQSTAPPDGLRAYMRFPSDELELVDLERRIAALIYAGKIAQASELARSPRDLISSNLFNSRVWRWQRTGRPALPVLAQTPAMIRDRIRPDLQGAALLCSAFAYLQNDMPDEGIRVYQCLTDKENGTLEAIVKLVRLEAIKSLIREKRLLEAEAIAETFPSGDSGKYEIVAKGFLESGLIDSGVTYAKTKLVSRRIEVFLFDTCLVDACEHHDWTTAKKIQNAIDRTSWRVHTGCYLARALANANQKLESESVLSRACEEATGVTTKEAAELSGEVMDCAHELALRPIVKAAATKIVKCWTSRVSQKARITSEPGNSLTDASVAFAVCGDVKEAVRLAFSHADERDQKNCLIRCADFSTSVGELANVDYVIQQGKDAANRWMCARYASRSIARYDGLARSHNWSCRRRDCMERLYGLIGAASANDRPMRK